MKAVVDTCIVLDALQCRGPFCHDAEAVFLLCANRQAEGFLTAKAVTDIAYLIHRHTHSAPETKKILEKLCTLFSVLDTAAADIRNALLSETFDFEDAVMIETAVRAGADCIVTRNARDYTHSPLPVYAPDAFVRLFDTAPRVSP